VRGAINNGCTVDEIREILIQASVYCGVPAGLDSFKVANEVLKEMGVIDDRPVNGGSVPSAKD
jgi:4-carboxymuconolactone decarboxylase